MTFSDDSLSESSEPKPVDPLTAPAWMFEQDDDILLAPPLEAFFSDFSSTTSNVVPPPKVDEIISGEYTGWIPIIQAGETLAQAQERIADTQVAQASELQQANSSQDLEAPSQPADNQQEESTNSQQAMTVLRQPIVADPDEVVSPAQALAEARERIAAMRASLQVNLNKVASSFEHPIFTTGDSEVVAEVDTRENSTQTTSSQQSISLGHLATKAEDSEVHEATEQSRVFIQTESITQPDSQPQSVGQDHSLELMIMRDEIKDLRDRLDASQKLIEDLMHRLANLAELALKRQL